ncbi:MAG TPA: hypothetical protein VKA15_02935, partial [Isosphaeraceae bacterium]|nr:hypothetical protein [Isosphaeraceae bacterium]
MRSKANARPPRPTPAASSRGWVVSIVLDASVVFKRLRRSPGQWLWLAHGEATEVTGKERAAGCFTSAMDGAHPRPTHQHA